jgi:hypothetical protein
LLTDAAGRTGSTVQDPLDPPPPPVAVARNTTRISGDIRRISAESSSTQPSKYGVSGVEVLSETSLGSLPVSGLVS